MRTMISGFSGGGLADLGYMQAGYTPIGAVEYDAATAEVYRANIGPHVRCESIMDTDWSMFDRPDLLHMSPECKEFSQAKASGAEGPVQRAQAEAICRALETLTPRCFVLENVVGYRRAKSLGRIVATLDRLGYMVDIQHVNSADYLVPQTRNRLILRAVRGGLVPHLPPKRRPWVGWYAAIADLIPTLPESKFANWQLARLEPLFGHTLVDCVHRTDANLTMRDADEPAHTIVGSHMRRPGNIARAFLAHPNADSDRFPAPVDTEPAFTVGTFQGGIPRAFLVGTNGENGDLCRGADDPAQAIAATHLAEKHRAFIVDGQANSHGETVTVRGDGEPCFTVPAHAAKHAARAWLEQGRVVAMTPRALARFQSVPDSYALPESRTLACRIIGNGVAVGVARAIGESLAGEA